MTTATAAVATQQLCTFWVDGLYLGVPVAQVQEVLRRQPMTPVPRAPEAVLGLINLRGQIVTAVDLRRRLGLGDRDPEHEAVSPPMNVIVRGGGEVISLVVDDIGDVVELPDATAAEPPANLPQRVREVVRHVLTSDPRTAPPGTPPILLVLDADVVVDLTG